MTREEIEKAAQQKLRKQLDERRTEYAVSYLRNVRQAVVTLAAAQEEYEKVVSMSDDEFTAEYGL